MGTAGELLVAKARDTLPGFSLVDEFLLCNGRPFPVKAAPPDAPRLTKRWCFRNAWLLVRESIAFTYGEGYCSAVNGEFFEHAWAVTAEGSAVDPTIPPAEVRDYFGVAYDRDDYLRWVGECPNEGRSPVILAVGFAQTPPEG